MATHLTTEALIHLRNNPKLQQKICFYIGVKISGMDSAIVRDSKALTTYKSVILIAEDMQVSPYDILIEYP